MPLNTEIERLAAIVASSTDAIISLDTQKRIQSWNAAAERLYGYTAAEAIGMDVAQVRSSESDNDQQVLLDRARGGEEIHGARTVRRHKDGTLIHVSISLAPMHGPGGELVGFASIHRDITAQVRAVEAVNSSEERYRLALKATSEVIWDWNMVTGALTLGDAITSVFGHPAEWQSTNVDTWYALLHPDDSRRIGASLEAFLAGRELTWTGEYRLRRGDGSYAIVSDHGYLIRSSDGAPIRMVGSMSDVTERRTTEEQLRLREERYRLVSRATQDLIWDWNMSTGLVDCSDAIHTVFGHPASWVEMTPADWFSIVHPDDVAHLREVSEGAAARGESYWTTELRVRRGDGSYAMVVNRAYIMRDDVGAPLRMVGSVTDVTERRKAENAMRKAAEVAEAANRAKSEFLANMSHEIRTPMNGVIGMIDLALDSDLSAQQRDFLETAKSSADSLLTLINDILDFSKIEAGKLQLDFVAFDPRALVSSTARSLAGPAAEKGLRLNVEFAPDVAALVVGDPARVRQILLNLAGNAIKFTERGEVTISLATDHANTPSASAIPVRITVRDTGIGIASEKLNSIFGAFIQEDASTTREHGGTGLGLAIAAQLASLMGGDIRVTSTAGVGSTFVLTIPFAAPVISEAAGAGSVGSARGLDSPRPAENVRVLNILLAEDNLVNQKLLRTLLERRGHRVIVASTGLEAVRANAVVAFDVILMDVHMPDLGGFEATQLIREYEEGTGRHVPIIAVTARAMVGDRERCLDAGMDDYLSKPVRRNDLYEALERWTRVDRSAIPGAMPATTEKDPIDLSALRSFVDGDSALLQELVILFKAEAPRLIEEIRRALDSGDASALREAAHTLKGSAASMTASGAAAAAHTLEMIGNSGSLDGARIAIMELEREIDRSSHALTVLAGEK